jgi:hypothetical protein
MKTPKKKNRQAIRRLLAELKDVLDAFGWYGVGDEGEPAKVAKKAAETTESIPNKLDAGDQHNEGAPPAATIREDPEEELEANGRSADEPFDDYSDDKYDYHGSSESWYYDPWDVQTALDSAMSNLVQSKLVPELADAKDAPSFSEVCGVLFGEGHEITKQAEYFEELIKGYEDQVSKDDLREAYTTLESLMEDIGWKKGVE